MMVDIATGGNLMPTKLLCLLLNRPYKGCLRDQVVHFMYVSQST